MRSNNRIDSAAVDAKNISKDALNRVECAVQALERSVRGRIRDKRVAGRPAKHHLQHDSESARQHLLPEGSQPKPAAARLPSRSLYQCTCINMTPEGHK